MKFRYLLSAALFGLSILPVASGPANAGLAGMTQSAIATDNTDMIQLAQHGPARAAPRRGVAPRAVAPRAVAPRAVGPRAVAPRAVGPRVVAPRVVAPVAGRGLYTGRYVYRGGPWVRPRAYWWPIGGAVLAGAALGVVVASTAVAWAGPPPGPGYCWYYTDPTRTQGFWDYCP